MEMGFTGERYVPTVQGRIRYEHLHRYALALELAQGKSVLDIASGEGYGSAYLSKVANSVIGVDIDRECVNFSRNKYGNIANLEFVVGSCDAIPLSSESLDIVTSFETLEHHDKHDEMMREIKRVLKPGGVLVISAPNRLTYSENPQSASANPNNQFHVKEPYEYQFVSLLSRYFKNVKLYGQRLAIGSFVFPLLPNNLPSTISAYTSKKDGLTREFCSLQEPIYFVAVCSDEINNTQKLLNSIFIDERDDVLIDLEKDTQAKLNQANSNLGLKDIRCSELQSEVYKLEELLSKYQSQLHQAEGLLEQSQSQLHQAEGLLEQSQSQLHQANSNLELKDIRCSELQSEVYKLQGFLSNYQSQLHQTELILMQSQSQLHETEAVLEQSQSQLHETQAVLEQSQSQLHEAQALLEQSQSQLHQTQAELEQSQSQLHETQAVLEQSQSQLHQTQAVLEQSQSQLHQTQAVLEQSQSQLHQTHGLWEQSQSQLHETEAVLEQSQSQLQEIQAQWEQSQSQLDETQAVLEHSQSQLQEIQAQWEQSQSQLHQTQALLSQYQSQLHHTDIVLVQYQSQLHETQTVLEQSQSQRHQTEVVLEQSVSQLDQTQAVLERWLFQQNLVATQTEGSIPMQYQLLLWDAWYAYRKGDMIAVAQCLQQSLKFTPLSRTETVVNWLERFAKLSSEKGCEFDTYSLTNSAEWKQLMRSITALRTVIAS
ncbi:methyltransferase domain-containing protein [Microcoleus vaginatus]|uniref:methyltransferase domain-containing protein n=1 Tax=Microcoleus vaginatus TaxID=119532 RepID=UPI0032ABD58E